MGGGHYYSFTKHRNDKQWYYYNDEIVGKVTKDEKIVSADAYILFYSKMSTDQFCRQTLRAPEMWPHIGKGTTPQHSESVQRAAFPRKAPLPKHSGSHLYFATIANDGTDISNELMLSSNSRTVTP